ncbi:orf1 [Faba bean necrotic yellows C1 alphasatellite]|uniref:Para-Rep C1 n=1 Tax=Faba bean necrotic yellows C1 alphasatellite TaxID=1453080 RepID=REP1_FBNC1|nr:orf1 [Faba bean necrotic yellows C1 alphasatellite]Q66862.1 RecName: Full=Para-Rep C1; Short=Rep1; AltName: Full=ATP-dependent helicase C1; AltName: Full=Replication-associated protein of non-essential DNA C1 [Faba bean necrotic yellows virus (isolate SV292-88)]CAA56847.1 orf1 [Faba bean necrotic yellows C1 alphasatellite]
MACSNWVFTRNFQGALPLLSFDERVQYAVWQHERGTHDHIQGVIQLKKKARFSTVKEIIGGNPHVEKMKGTIEEASAYVQKEETRVAGPWSYGDLLKRGSHRRKTMERYLEDPEEMQLKDPDTALRCNAKRLKEDFMKEKTKLQLRPWQKELHDLILTEPDDRTIIWVYGPDGGEGKSMFAKELIKYGWFYTAGGKTQDILYMYAQDPERNIAFDVPRCSSEMMNYQAMEMMKNRCFASTKYRSVDLCCNKNVHLVVFANVAYDPTKISEDRIVIINC